MNNIYSHTENNCSDLLIERNKKFLKEVHEELNKKVWPVVKDRIVDAKLFQGFFMSDEYAQYKMEFYDKDKEIVLEVVLDVVCGEAHWKY